MGYRTLSVVCGVLSSAFFAQWTVAADAPVAPAATPPPAAAPAAAPAPPARPAVEPPTVAEGFVANVFASAPDVMSPASMCVAPDGRVFVGEDPYNTGDGTTAGMGRIRLCVDTDHDGNADKFTLFADKINSPQGQCFVDGTLYVTHAPFLSALRDTDGDGVADVREDLISGLGPEPKDLVHHVPSGVRMGIDGWLYISIGDKGIPGATAKDGSKVRMQGGGVVRVRTDGSHLQIFSHGQRNIYDVSIDPLLNVFTRDNTNDGNGWNSLVTLVQRDANYGYPNLFKNYNDEVAPHIADYGGGSATGSIYVHDGTWPGGWGQSLYTCDWVKGTVYRHQLTPDGAGYTLSSDDFFKCTDPTDVDIDANGCFYVSDWARRSWGKSDARGVVFRVVPKGYPSTQPTNAARAAAPNVAELESFELIDELRSPRAVRRLAAQRELLRRGPAHDMPAALVTMMESDEPLYVRAAAMFTLVQMQGADSTPALLAAADKPETRELAIHALSDRKETLAKAGAASFTKYLNDANSRVRVQSLIALEETGDASAASAMLPLTADADVRVRHAALRALRALDASDVCLAVLKDPKSKPEIVDGAMRVLRDMHEAKVVDEVQSMLASSSDPKRSISLLNLLARLYQTEGEWDGGWWSPWPETKGPYVKAVKWESSPAIASILSSRIGDGNPDIAKVAVDKAGEFEVIETAPALATLATNDSPHRADAVAAITKLSAADPTVRQTLEQIASSAKFTPEQRNSAIVPLAKIDGPDGSAILIRIASTLASEKDAPQPVVDAAAGALAERRAEESQVPDIVKLAHCEAPSLRGGAAAALVRSDAPAAKEAVLQLYGETDTDATETILTALKRVPVQAASAYLAQTRALLTDKRNAVRQAAASALGYVGDAESIPALLKLSARAIDRSAAIEALAAIGPEKTTDDQILTVTKFLADSAASLAGTSDAALYAKALQSAEKFLQDKRIPSDQMTSLSTKLQMAGVVADYQSAGPIKPASGDAFAASFAPEDSPNGPFTPFTVSSETFDWKPVKVTNVEGHYAMPMPDNSVQYFAATVTAPTAGPAILSVRSDDGIVIWVNGTKVHANQVARAVIVAVDQVHINLNAGANTVLFRVNNISGEAGLSARVRYRVGEFEPAELAPALKDRPIDVDHGKELFTKLGCVQCHTTHPEEPSKGPFLGDVGGKFSREQLTEAVLRPNATIAQGFTTQRVVTSDMKKGDELLGFIVKDTDAELDIRDLTGKVTVIPKSKILKHGTRPQSMMPQGLADALTPDEFVTLLSYLESLKPGTPQQVNAAPPASPPQH